MEIIFVGDTLQRAGLVHPKLNALQADDALYTVLTYQPHGRIRIADDSIGHAEPDDANRKIKSFFERVVAMENQPDLVIAPEYSVPWDTLLKSIEAGLRPALGKLWVLGCESLPLGLLDRHRDRLGDKAIVLDDDISPKQRTTQRYRNPLVYVFVTECDADAAQRLVLLVQYKTEPSGDPGNTEATGMLPGKNVYVFGRQPEEVKLMTLICSDVFGFNDALIKQHYDGLLLLHVQLNNSPRHVTYKNYRQELFQYAGRTEAICLNWAEKITSVDQNGQNEHPWNNIGGSAWYLLPAEFDLSDERIAENHVHGVYYTRHEPIRVHALQFHYKPRVFFFQSTKVFHHAISKPRSTRSGPKVLKTFFWSEEAAVWSEANKPEERPDDGFATLLAGVNGGIDLDDVWALYKQGPVPVERAMAIAAGEFGPYENWYQASRIDSMKLCEQEIVRRLTVTQDPAPEAVKFRSERLGSVSAIVELRSVGYEWPMGVEVLRQGFRFVWSQKYPGRNVVAADGTLATVVHLPLVGDTANLERLDQRVRKTLAGPPPEPERLLSEEEEQAFQRQHYSTKAERVCILYSTATGSKPYVSPRSLSFTSPAGQSPVDIGVPSFRRIAGEQPGAQS